MGKTKMNMTVLYSQIQTSITSLTSVQLFLQKCAVAAMGIRKEFTKGGGCCGGEESKVKVAVRNLTLSVNEGEVMGLLGPNGAGKTTSMNVITADTKANRGQVSFPSILGLIQSFLLTKSAIGETTSFTHTIFFLI